MTHQEKLLGRVLVTNALEAEVNFAREVSIIERMCTGENFDRALMEEIESSYVM